MPTYVATALVAAFSSLPAMVFDEGRIARATNDNLFSVQASWLID